MLWFTLGLCVGQSGQSRLCLSALSAPELCDPSWPDNTRVTNKWLAVYSDFLRKIPFPDSDERADRPAEPGHVRGVQAVEVRHPRHPEQSQCRDSPDTGVGAEKGEITGIQNVAMYFSFVQDPILNLDKRGDRGHFKIEVADGYR